MNRGDTIAAIATAPGVGGIGVVRVSGPLVENIAKSILSDLPKPRMATYKSFKNPKEHFVIDEGIALYYPAPHSFTGESVLELQGHGGNIVLNQTLEAVLSCGARLAAPGEFSQRSFLNNKIDLSQAEAIQDLIHARSETAATAAVNSLQGKFSAKINCLLKQLIQLRVQVEAAIDFPEEEVDFLAEKNIQQAMDLLCQRVDEILALAIQGQRLTQNISATIVGPPNAGKSSLLNCLTGQPTAIVTKTPGTTRDIITMQVLLSGVMINLQDTAGLRVTTCDIEQQGIARAKKAANLSPLLIWVVDGSQVNKQQALQLLHQSLRVNKNQKVLIIMNKIDLCHLKPTIEEKEENVWVNISAKNNLGIEQLKKALQKIAFDCNHDENLITARMRHIEAIKKVQQHMRVGKQYLNTKQGELIAEELKLAQRALSEITGAFSSDDLLGEIFSEFCIGK